MDGADIENSILELLEVYWLYWTSWPSDVGRPFDYMRHNQDVGHPLVLVALTSSRRSVRVLLPCLMHYLAITMAFWWL